MFNPLSAEETYTSAKKLFICKMRRGQKNHRIKDKLSTSTQITLIKKSCFHTFILSIQIYPQRVSKQLIAAVEATSTAERKRMMK